MERNFLQKISENFHVFARIFRDFIRFLTFESIFENFLKFFKLELMISSEKPWKSLRKPLEGFEKRKNAQKSFYQLFKLDLMRGEPDPKPVLFNC